MKNQHNKGMFGLPGSFKWSNRGSSRTICEFNPINPILGIEKFVFTFLKSKSSIYHFPIWKKDYLSSRESTVYVIVVVSPFEFNYRGRCESLVSKRVRSQNEGRNMEMLVFSLFSTISEKDHLVGRPRYKGDIFRRYDLQIPVRSQRARGEILVPVEIKSSLTGQKDHMRNRPRIPSVVVSKESFLRLIEPCQEMLHVYVNEGRAIHIS